MGRFSVDFSSKALLDSMDFSGSSMIFIPLWSGIIVYSYSNSNNSNNNHRVIVNHMIILIIAIIPRRRNGFRIK